MPPVTPGRARARRRSYPPRARRSTAQCRASRAPASARLRSPARRSAAREPPGAARDSRSWSPRRRRTSSDGGAGRSEREASTSAAFFSTRPRASAGAVHLMVIEVSATVICGVRRRAADGSQRHRLHAGMRTVSPARADGDGVVKAAWAASAAGAPSGHVTTDVRANSGGASMFTVTGARAAACNDSCNTMTAP